MVLTILGCNAASPAFGRHPTSQVLEINGELFLIDCGEAAQMQMQKFKVKSNRINKVFISHLHGDHYFGLIGWLNSQALNGRIKPITIFCPEKLKAIIEIQLDYALPFTINYIFLENESEKIIFENEKISISSFGVTHSVPTWGFKFTQKNRKRILIPEKVRALEIPKYFYKSICEGKDYVNKDGTIVKNELLSINGKGDVAYAFSADTLYNTNLVANFKNVNCLYHEATYVETEHEKASLRFHSTAKQAATIAKLANAKQLIIGHYSSKYQEIDLHLDEAKCIFANVQCATEGQTYCIE